ncbi:hypothetical protein M441DRAFT_76410 [Trichoderma asperellum CBS 433.97]|uniref:Uncharacterized protein n=1 Tax=Trichoderma asperellum (strain ATCC 204424 / CBS 433.97 / NBRC 101777) TaxID=1042311 RepID=A0A2T3ZKG1_TRIA4|nr:hypothetical protein M441DRAFT_76410 [Trichoderma asperellum CBS 433.97]PTB45294.1 hypothetical protein M441DRAFT_76410 [Trichoderma asperellum CBS 433.97]
MAYGVPHATAFMACAKYPSTYYSSTGASSFLAPISLLFSPLLSSPSFAYHKVHIQGSLNFSGSTSTDANFFSVLSRRYPSIQSWSLFALQRCS